ncbi:hypothetical protein ACLOJK_022869 [Asimina triloba]
MSTQFTVIRRSTEHQHGAPSSSTIRPICISSPTPATPSTRANIDPVWVEAHLNSSKSWKISATHRPHQPRSDDHSPNPSRAEQRVEGLNRRPTSTLQPSRSRSAAHLHEPVPAITTPNPKLTVIAQTHQQCDPAQIRPAAARLALLHLQPWQPLHTPCVRRAAVLFPLPRAHQPAPLSQINPKSSIHGDQSTITWHASVRTSAATIQPSVQPQPTIIRPITAGRSAARSSMVHLHPSDSDPTASNA